MYNIGDRVRIKWVSDGEVHEGTLDRHLEGDEAGYWFVDDKGEEHEVLGHALFRGEQTIERLS